MRRKLVISLLILTALLGIYLWSLPDPAELRTKTPAVTAFQRLRLSEAESDGRRYKVQQRLVALRDISPMLREAVRLSEDASFYDHDGFDFDEIEHAVEQSVRERRSLRGASTISQQLVKNVYLSPSRNPVRKIAEAYLTYRLERSVDKNRILELYLNVIEWGDGLYGVEAAAQRYFGEHAFSVAPAHAVLLAAMLPMPLKVDPRKPNRWLARRARRLLGELHAMARISDVEFAEAAMALGP